MLFRLSQWAMMRWVIHAITTTDKKDHSDVKKLMFATVSAHSVEIAEIGFREYFPGNLRGSFYVVRDLSD
jgi:hypothetical protein